MILPGLAQAAGAPAPPVDLLLAAVDQEVESDNENDEYGEESDLTIADPLRYWNMTWYHFNDKFYFWLLKPAAHGYKAVTPTFFRRGVKNFFDNLLTPKSFVNCLLQGKITGAGHELSRFLINTIFGFGGLVDMAATFSDIQPENEDFGQTLGSWRMGHGFYLVWPFLGPSSLRDSVGYAGDYFLDPVSYIDSDDWEIALGIRAYDVLNDTTFRLGDYEAFKKGTLDPYVSMRNAYIQNRFKKVNE